MKAFLYLIAAPFMLMYWIVKATALTAGAIFTRSGK